MDFSEISASDLGNILGISERRVRQLAAEGKIPKPARGKFDGPACVRAVLEAARADRPESALEKARARAIDARARAQEIKIAREERELISMEEAMAAIEEVTAAFVVGIESLPTRLTRNMQIRAELEEMIFNVREEVADKIGKRAENLRKGIEHDDGN